MGFADSFNNISKGLGTNILLGSNPKPPRNEEDSRLKRLRKDLTSEATQFRSGLEGQKKEEQGLLRNEASQALNQGIENTRENFNRRGLLYSGYRQGAEAGVRGQIQSGLEQSIVGSNRELEDLAKSKETAAAEVGLSGWRDSLARSQQLQDIRMENAIKRRQAIQQLGQAAGYGYGSYLDKQDQQTVTRDLERKGGHSGYLPVRNSSGGYSGMGEGFQGYEYDYPGDY